MVMDWREMVGRATIDQNEVAGDYMRLPPSLGRHKEQQWSDHTNGSREAASIQGDLKSLAAASAESATLENQSSLNGYSAADPRRGWMVALSWVIASAIE
jgi:hypothetical protein